MFLLIFLALTNLWAIEPKSYEKKKDIKTTTEVVGERIYFNFGFKDLDSAYQEWRWDDHLPKLKNSADQFGILVRDPVDPKYYAGDPGTDLFIKHPLAGIIPDYNKLIPLYQNSVIEIYRNWQQLVTSKGLSRREAVELLLRFMQDYPYGIPPRVVGQKFIGGLLVPPLVLEKGWADCDSKSLLMATVLSYDPYYRDKLAMILVPGHALLGIEMTPMTYDETYDYQNRTFVVAEPTGLSRTPLGRKNSPYTNLIGIIPLTGFASPVPESTSLKVEIGATLTEADCPDGGLVVEIFSKVENAKIQVCMIKEGANFIKHGPLVKFDPTGRFLSKEIYIRGKLRN